MNTLIRAHTLKSMAGSLVPNVGLTWLALRHSPQVPLMGPAPNLLTVLLPAAAMTALITVVLTYATIVAARKRGELQPPLAANATWLLPAGLLGLGLAALAAAVVAAGAWGLREPLATAQADRLMLVLAAATMGLLVALLAALLATRQAQHLGNAPAVSLTN